MRLHRSPFTESEDRTTRPAKIQYEIGLSRPFVLRVRPPVTSSGPRTRYAALVSIARWNRSSRTSGSANCPSRTSLAVQSRLTTRYSSGNADADNNCPRASIQPLWCMSAMASALVRVIANARISPTRADGDLSSAAADAACESTARIPRKPTRVDTRFIKHPFVPYDRVGEGRTPFQSGYSAALVANLRQHISHIRPSLPDSVA